MKPAVSLSYLRRVWRGSSEPPPLAVGPHWAVETWEGPIVTWAELERAPIERLQQLQRIHRSNAECGVIAVYPSVGHAWLAMKDRGAFHRLSAWTSEFAQMAIDAESPLLTVDEAFLLHGTEAEVLGGSASYLSPTASRSQHPESTYVLEGKERVLSLPSPLNWELEQPTLRGQQITQAPAGELFAHFECTWSYEDVEIAMWHHDAWRTIRISAEDGIVIRAQPSVQWILGRRIVEIGVGLNESVSLRPVSWAEKSIGAVHLGLGGRMQGDCAPPSVHFDVLMPSASLIVNGLRMGS